MKLNWKLLLSLPLCITLAGATTGLSFLAISAVYKSFYFPTFTVFIRYLDDVIGVMLLSVMYTLLWFAVYFILFTSLLIRRILRVTKAVQHIAEGDLTQRIKISAKDEIGQLEHNINIMAEQLSKSIEEERRAEQTKTELVTNVSHDLRTPLTSIIGYLGLVEQDKYRDELELRHYISIAYEKSKRLHLMIEDLFEYTRMSGGMPLHLGRVNLSELVGQLYVHYRYPMEQVGLQLRMNNADQSLFMMADSLKLVRVFENLLSNAMKYGTGGDAVDLNVSVIADEAQIEIVNYGTAIPQQDLPYVFDRFYRVDKSRGEEQEGSGLGLAISRAIVELHNGSIWAESNSFQTRFVIRLPLTS
ncbi:HAMP domain-containing sensor histidine kinase [Paenibacillus sp. UMB4589-SE434]|uniref:sensor histidine kinase n=1 Tax=Paenibacillus sp. UMB4589-SE434 TaxID=3046314 RepID=UPI00254A5033|nr:HAMP domain-containing sensor histidine kinase [Paenibacillus sp. UMB4589-SE434]MDK8183452.1 HAMP domain-containing sensor histidine kinase [Paenibacillus sp. UMB4589-SE434]